MLYQWKRNGVNVPGATNTSYSIVNVQTNDLANFSVVISDDVSVVESSNVWLYPLISPNFVETPISQSVAIGTPVTLSAQANGWPPPFTFSWLLGSAPQVGSTNITDDPTSFYTFTAPATVTSVSYRAVVRNRAFPSGRVSPFAVVTTLADSDNDGIPDVWEAAYGFDSGSYADRLTDMDGDGMANWQEYQAGTDPTNALSNLKINLMSWTNGIVRMQFQAMSNKTYTVQQINSLSGTNWQSLARIVSRRTNHTEILADPNATGNRFYRIITPALP
jgi:hypothetical protein